jgi:hypothetical protein
MVFSTKKRFIAGAVCSACKKIDVIMVFNDGENDWQLCVECGFKQSVEQITQDYEMQTVIIKDIKTSK